MKRSPIRWRVHSFRAAMMLCFALVVALTACGSDSDNSGTSGGSTTSDTSSLTEAPPGWKTGTPNAREVAFASADNAKSVRIAVLSASASNAYWHQIDVAAKEVAKARNAKVDVFDAEFDPAKQQAQFQDALATGRYDAYIVIAVDGVALIPLVKQAVESGAKVVATGDLALGTRFDTSEPQVDGMAGSVNTTNKAIAERLGKPCYRGRRRATMPARSRGFPQGATTPAEEAASRTGGSLRDVIEPHSNIELVAVQNGEFLADSAKTAASDILTAHKDLDVFVTAGDQMAYGAQLAIEDRNKTGDVQTIGLGASFQGVEQVKAGEMFGTVPLLPYDDGLYSADIALRAVRGQTIAKPVLDAVEVSGIPPQLTKENSMEIEFEGQFTNS